MATQKQLAAHLDLSDRSIRNLVTEGIIGASDDVDQARVKYIRHLRAVAAGRTEVGGDLETEKTRLTKAQADKTELEVAQLRKVLVPADLVEREWTDMISAARAKLLSLPPKAASQVMAAANRTEAEALLKAMVNEALAELAEGGDYAARPPVEEPAGVEPAAEPDRVDVGGRKPASKRGGQRRARPVQ
jgi:phage terminase Nu1 subunit (DNA packaging protein)